ncbi:MAG: hypothetical protein AB7U82_10905 [Blastocatellales bacterium]
MTRFTLFFLSLFLLASWQAETQAQRPSAQKPNILLIVADDLGYADIGEQNNLAEKEPAKLKQLAAAWDEWNAGLQEPRWVPQRGARNRRR